jgi:hypothetical protein
VDEEFKLLTVVGVVTRILPVDRGVETLEFL